MSPVALRGPSFTMPAQSGFSMLMDEQGDEDAEPNCSDIFEAVDKAFDTGRVSVSSMESEPITFAGFGEPLLRTDCICDAVRQIKDSRHGAIFRIKTNGLIRSADGLSTALKLQEAGIDKISVSLISENPTQYQQIMQPKNGATFSDVCSFVMTCAEIGLDVECTAVDRPDVHVGNVRALALALGAASFRSAKYFP